MTNQLLVLLGYLVCEESLFTCCFKSLSLSLDFDSFMMMCLVSLYEFFFFFFLGLLHFLNVQMNVFHQIWEVFGYFFFKIFLPLFIASLFIRFSVCICWYV